MNKNNLTSAIVHSIYEYLLIVLPVAIFIAIESSHKGWNYLYKSPEWSIATIFLAFQSISLFGSDMKKSGRDVSDTTLNFMRLISIVIVVLAAINTYSSLDDEHNTVINIGVRWLFFAITSIFFFFLVSAGKSLK